ncbi:MAG: hypothetical protein ACTSWD_04815 [Candidatus Heimdallarchaeota archaeon]
MNMPTDTAARIIRTINPKFNYSGALCRKTNTTIGTVVKIVNGLKDEGFLKMYKQGRKNLVILTEKGERLRYLMEAIKEL